MHLHYRNLLAFIKKIVSNKVVWYIFSRYFVYFISFLASMIMAAKLGPYYLGIWGFATLLLRYFQIVDLGLGSSTTVFLVKNKGNAIEQAKYEKAALFILLMMFLGVIIVGLYYYLFGISIFDKYHLENLFYVICLIAIFQYFNYYALCVSRVKGKIFEFTFNQSIGQILTFIGVFLASGEKLLYILFISCFIGQLLSTLVYLTKKSIDFSGKLEFARSKKILNKGVFLFIYNFCFYMILMSTKTIVSRYYSIEEFGYFTFSCTLANAAMLLLSAFSSLITPKLLDKFNTNNATLITSTVRTIRINYVYFSHGIMYIALACFPVLLLFLPKYQDTFIAINLTSLATLLYSNSFGYISFLTIKNKEKTIALISSISFIVNVILAFVLARVFYVSYEYVIISTLISYFLFTCLIVYRGKKLLGVKQTFKNLLEDVFPVKLLIPYVAASIVTFLNNGLLMLIPLFLFIILNLKEICEIYNSFRKILVNPSVVDMK